MKEQYNTNLSTLRLKNLKTGVFIEVDRFYFNVDLAVANSAEVDTRWLHSDREYHLANYRKEKQTLDSNDLMSVTDKFLILRGIAGIVKTSLIEHLLLQWANGAVWNGSGSQPSFQFVFRFAARELDLFQSKISIKGLFERFYPCVPLEDFVTRNVDVLVVFQPSFQFVFRFAARELNLFQSKISIKGLFEKFYPCVPLEDLVKWNVDVLVVFDGLDEFYEQSEILQSARALLTDETSKGAVKHNIIIGIFPCQTTIVASRPEGANILHLMLGTTFSIKRVDVVGFSKEKVSKYVSNFTDAIEKPHLKEPFLLKTDEHENLMAMS